MSETKQDIETPSGDKQMGLNDNEKQSGNRLKSPLAYFLGFLVLAAIVLAAFFGSRSSTISSPTSLVTDAATSVTTTADTAKPTTPPTSAATSSAAPTNVESLTPTNFPTMVESSTPTSTCQLEYPSKPQATCVGQFDPQMEDAWGSALVGYTFEMDCQAFGNFDNHTGLWELGRTSISVMEGEDFDWNVVYNSDVWRNDWSSWDSGNSCLFQIPVLGSFGGDLSCLRIRYQDEDCGTEYTSDCIDLSTCPSNNNVEPSCQVVYPYTPDYECKEREPHTQCLEDDDTNCDWDVPTHIAYSFNLTNCADYRYATPANSTARSHQFSPATGLFEENRGVTVVAYDQDWKIIKEDYMSQSYCSFWFDLPIEEDLSCVRFQFKDDGCKTFYTSDCVEIFTCHWD